MRLSEVLQHAVDSRDVVKITVSKPRVKGSDVKNVYLRPVVIKDEYMFQRVSRTKTQDFTQNYPADDIIPVLEQLLRDDFYNATLLTREATFQYMQSKKGKETLLKKNESHDPVDLQHNRDKEYNIGLSEPFLRVLEITSEQGRVYAHKQAKYRQINKFIEVIKSLVSGNFPEVIYDMGSGKGYLTFALYAFLSKMNDQVKIVGVEVRQDMVDKCNAMARELGFAGLSFQLGSIHEYDVTEADMIIALHACDIATDMAIAKGVNAGARYIVVAPCCQKQVRKDMQVPEDNPLYPILKNGILLERQAVMITDGIRAMLLEREGYTTKVFEFISTEHTAKNIMITASLNGTKNKHIQEKIDDLKTAYGVKSHYLESLLC